MRMVMRRLVARPRGNVRFSEKYRQIINRIILKARLTFHGLQSTAYEERNMTFIETAGELADMNFGKGFGVIYRIIKMSWCPCYSSSGWTMR